MKLLTMADVSDLLIFCLLARGVKVVYRTKELEEQQASRIWNETWLAGFFFKPCKHKLFLMKQALNMEMAIVMARYSIKRLLADVPDDVDMVIFPNYESSVERDDIKDPFSEKKKLCRHSTLDSCLGFPASASAIAEAEATRPPLPIPRDAASVDEVVPFDRSFYLFKLFGYEPRLKIYKLMLPLLPCGNAIMKGLTCWLSRSTRSTAGKASRKPHHERAMALKGCEEEFLMIAEYTSLLAYNQGKIISVYAKQPASWVCASCLSEREDLCWAVKGCARIWWSSTKRSLQLQLRFVRFMGTNHPDAFPRLIQRLMKLGLSN
ncbi:hypothetical protein TRIUR3_05831 [Triticum urartu]|uniref:Uncharacterized protein n=1 Tax=Triticum urartu TaxID=4572 RepID=M7Z4G5_TRIUA|nr:hypothetical protein TRIUR3_05831 [Triticum urartu]